MRKIQHVWTWLTQAPTKGPKAIVLLRLMVGSVFFWEGIMKFAFPNLGVGRFTKLGFPAPEFTSTFVALLEIIGGSLVIAGWQTRLFSILFVFEMLVAMLSTKISLYLGHYPLALPSSPPQVGLWAVLHEIRAEWALFLVSLFTMIEGPGVWSLDALSRRGRENQSGFSPTKDSVKRFAASVGMTALLLLIPVFLHASASESRESQPARQGAPSAFQEGQAALKQNDYKTAVRFFGAAVEEHPHDPDALNMLAFSERKQGNLADAFQNYEKALKIRPHFPEAREYLAEAYLQAALTELKTLQSYGVDGKEEAEEVVQGFQKATREIKP